MTRLVHSRALISILVVLLQVSLLPGAGRLQCMLRSGTLSCCCVPHADSLVGERESGAHDCCGRGRAVAATSRPAADEARSIGGGVSPDPGGCGCGGLTPPPAIKPGPGSDESSVAKAQTAVPPCAGSWPSYDRLAASTRAALRPIPRASTGPPLRILYQVFLI